MKITVVSPKFMVYMKRILALLVVGFAFQAAVMAQPTVSFSTESACTGEQVCMDVAVKDFTDILFMSFTMQWDPAVLQFNQVQGFNLPGLTGANFNTGNAVNGTVDLSWQFGNCPDGAGRTEADGHVIFQICFTVLSNQYGQVGTVSIPTSPVPIVYRTNVGNCTNIGLLTKDGVVSTCVAPISFIATNETGNEGDLVCVDFTVTGFQDMRSAQFTVVYDPAVLEFQNIIAGDVPNLSATGSFGLPGVGGVQPGNITMSWSYFITGEPPVTLPDGHLFFQACFRIIGPCESFSTVTFDSIPTQIEFTNDNVIAPGYNIFFQPVPGSVEVGDCAPTGLQLIADCGSPVNLNDPICVGVSVGNNFTNISDAAFLMEWNPAILQFTGVQNLATLSGLNQADFNAANAANGILGFNWAPVGPPSASIPPGGDLFEVCFNVIGLGGNSPFSFTQPANVQVNNGANIGINPSNCTVQVNQPAGVVMTIGDGSAAPGEEVCLDFTVSNFEDILSYQFSVAFDPAHMEWTSIQNITLPEASLANFITAGASAGSISFDWEPSTSHTLPDGTVIFQMCFQPVGSPQQCDVLEVVGLPIVPEAINTTSNGENIGIVDTPGEVCILYPEGFGLVIGDIEGDIQDTVCLPVQVVSFDNITSAEFDISWDPSELEFVNVNIPGTWPGLSASNFVDGGSPVGLLEVSWTNGTPVAIADSAVVFELCFKLVGAPRMCNDVVVNDTPIPVVTTANGAGSMLFENGSVCINDRIVIDSVHITPVSCPGACDGEIELFVSGGLTPVGFVWQTTPLQNTSKARFLCEGTIVVFMFDSYNPAVTRTDTFYIPTTTDLPQANAGPDKQLGCNPNTTLLSGSGSQGAEYTYQWTNITTGQAFPADVATIVTGAAGDYIYEVTNTTTGCSVADTTVVTAAVLPTAIAGLDQTFNCINDVVGLDGTQSTGGGTVEYTWTALSGGNVVAGQENNLLTIVDGPGVYQLAVRITLNNCTAYDTVAVTDARIFPNANGGPDLELGCSGDPVMLDASPSDNGTLDVSYEWFDATGNPVSTDITYSTNALGTYEVVVTENISGCSTRDTVFVIPSADYPDIMLEDSTALTCSVDTVSFEAVISPDTITYTLQWNPLDGGALLPGTETTLTPQTDVAGMYELVITNTDNNCVSRDTIQVLLDNMPPVANAGENTSLTCDDASVTLDGSASEQGANYTYTWRDIDGAVIGVGLTYTATEPGTYCFEVVSDNGCSATDCVVVGITGAPPVLLVDDFGALNCLNDTLAIVVNASPPNVDYDVSWQILSGTGNIVSEDTTTIEVDQPGAYEITVTAISTGCTTIDTIEVLQDIELPDAVAGTDQSLTCIVSAASLNGAGSSVGVDFTYEWTNIVDGALPSPNTQITASVNTAGTYEILVSNITNGCTARDTVVVLDDTDPPVINLAEPENITCIDEDAELNASATTPNTDITVTWTTLSGGGAATPPNNLMANANAAGDYEILVRNNINGCESRDTITVLANTDPPQISYAQPAQFGCNQTSVPIDATATGPVNSFSSISWTTLSGDGTVTPATGSFSVQVSEPGDYELTVVRADNGCEATETITVEADPNVPVADAGEDQNIECGETASLGGTGTSQGAGIIYSWTVVDGAPLTGNTNEATSSSQGEGTYQLIVSNAAGCADTSVVAITLDYPESANAGQDLSLCEPSSSLSANLPTGTTGVWTTSSSAGIATPTDANTEISALQQGANAFIWTLSAPNCPNYSADTVVISIALAPNAANDVLTVGSDSRDATVNLIANDGVSLGDNFVITLASQPTFGRVDSISAEGVLYFSVNRGAAGQTEVQYVLCNLDCATSCDTALVAITVESDGFVPDRPNTITPNEDGLNETLIFDEILNNPSDMFPDNELIIFNRWGDIVYQSKPYNNDWRGLNSEGKELPHGTYYYILRLDISNGVIIRGDVTIVK